MTSKYTYEKVWTGPSSYQIRQHHKTKIRVMKSEDNPDYLVALAAGEVTEVPYIPPPPYIPSLDELKQTKIRDIMNRTSQIIANGFWHDGVRFSLSVQNMTEWAWLALADSQSKITYPMGVTTYAHNEYTIADKQSFGSWVDAGLTVMLGIKAAERALFAQVHAAQDQTELDAIVDDRVG